MVEDNIFFVVRSHAAPGYSKPTFSSSKITEVVFGEFVKVLSKKGSWVKVLQNDGVIVIFPSGQIATKEDLKLNTKANDGDWKQFVSKLIIKTKSPVLPSYFEGQNSQLYHIANKIGQTFSGVISGINEKYFSYYQMDFEKC